MRKDSINSNESRKKRVKPIYQFEEELEIDQSYDD